MPQQDTSGIKEKIISIIRRNGPSLPARISREIELSILFTSAFLSELASEKRLKISNMKVGNSPLYFIEGQESMLEKFSHHLKSKEKEAFALLKEKKFLVDSKQAPAIRVALRGIRDFAIPFKKDEEIVWRFFLIPQEEFTKEKRPKIPVKKELVREKPLGIFDEPLKPIKKPRKIQRRKTPVRENKFFNRVKEFLSERSIELLDIEGFSKDEILLRIRDNGREKVLIAYNKKRISDNDIIKAAKKTSEFNLPYMILGLGEPLKKVSGLIEAMKNLSSIEKLK